MTEDILKLMDKRRQAKCNNENYEAIHREIRNKCDEAKENWIKEKIKKILHVIYDIPHFSTLSLNHCSQLSLN